MGRIRKSQHAQEIRSGIHEAKMLLIYVEFMVDAIQEQKTKENSFKMYLKSKEIDIEIYNRRMLISTQKSELVTRAFERHLQRGLRRIEDQARDTD